MELKHYLRIHGLDYRRFADMIGMPHKTVERLLHGGAPSRADRMLIEVITKNGVGRHDWPTPFHDEHNAARRKIHVTPAVRKSYPARVRPNRPIRPGKVGGISRAKTGRHVYRGLV